MLGGNLVFDSGDKLEQITEAAFPNLPPAFPAVFNASNANNNFDDRSDNKGPEPEGVTVAKVFGRTYAFICLERIGGVVIFDCKRAEASAFCPVRKQP